ncbi:MAG: sporulation membrane protein YtaF [Bacillota bacterium]|nr:sporulation membrane protein YtaF [Bacillota bacterium]
MQILSAFLFAFSANVDNLAVGVTYGIRKLKIGLLNSIIIAFMSCLGTFISMLLGKIICKFVPINITDAIGSFLLIGLGVWSIYESEKPLPNSDNNDKRSDHYKLLSYDELLNEPEKADLDNSGFIDLKESVMLGIALAFNNMGMGIGGSIIGLNILLTSILTFVLSLVFISLGCYLGKKITSSHLGKLSGIIAGFLIMSLGIYELLK